MPATRLERILVFTGLLGAVALALLAFTAWQDYRDSRPTTPSAATSSAPNESAAVAGTTAERLPRPAPSSLASLELIAARGDSWLEVRSGSGQGESLFVDILDRGQRERFREKRLWLRFGAAQNVDAVLNGDPVDLPPGTSTVVITPTGVRPVGAG